MKCHEEAVEFEVGQFGVGTKLPNATTIFGKIRDHVM